MTIFAQFRSPCMARGTSSRLDLTEERADVAELVVPPVVEQPRGLRRDPPLGAGQRAPFADAVAHALDHPHQLILLSVFVGGPVSIIETQLGLLRALLAGGGDRGDERDTPAAVDDTVGGLAVLIELPVPRRGTRRASSVSAVRKTPAPRRHTTRIVGGARNGRHPQFPDSGGKSAASSARQIIALSCRQGRDLCVGPRSHPTSNDLTARPLSPHGPSA